VARSVPPVDSDPRQGDRDGCPSGLARVGPYRAKIILGTRSYSLIRKYAIELQRSTIVSGAFGRRTKPDFKGLGKSPHPSLVTFIDVATMARQDRRQETLLESHGRTKDGSGKMDSKRLSSKVLSEAQPQQQQQQQRGLEASLKDLELRLRSEFDLESKFGPVMGMTRMERFERAEKLCLSPPEWVKEAILVHGLDSDMNMHLFTRGKI
jgi:hypothetical protein